METQCEPTAPINRLAKERKLFVAVPIMWGVDPLFFRSCLTFLIQFKQESGTILDPNIGDSAIGRSRNTLTRRFLESDCTHMLMIDSDLVFGADQVKRMLDHGEELVGGLYCKKQEGTPQMVLNTFPDGVQKKEDERGLLPVRYVGTGFMIIARSVFEKMIEKFGDEMWYASDVDQVKEYDFWHMGPYQYADGSRRYLSEDWWFCQKALDIGITVWADIHVLAKHSGHALYPLSYQEKELFGARPVGVGSDQAPVDVSVSTLAGAIK